MRVLHISGAMTWRGGEQQLINLYNALHESGVQQAVFCPRNSALSDYCLTENITHHTYTNISGFNIFAALRLKKMCTTDALFDVIHLHDSDAHTLGYIASLIGTSNAMVLSRKVAFKIKGSLFTIRKYNAACIRKIICVSEAVKRVVAGTVKDRSKLTVIYEGIKPLDRDKILPLSLPHAITDKKFEFLVGYVAALTPEKDHETFLQAAHWLVQRGMSIGFLLAGEGKDRKLLEERVKELGLSGHVFLIGFCKEIPALLKQLDVLLFTSVKEGFPITILEAFFMRVAVVTTEAGGIAEMVENGETGFKLPVGAAQQLAEKTALVLQDPHPARQAYRKCTPVCSAVYVYPYGARSDAGVQRSLA